MVLEHYIHQSLELHRFSEILYINIVFSYVLSHLPDDYNSSLLIQSLEMKTFNSTIVGPEMDDSEHLRTYTIG